MSRSTDSRLLRATIRARRLRCRRSTDNQYDARDGALPAHPSGDARDAANRWIEAQASAASGSTRRITGEASAPCTKTDSTIVKDTVDHSQSAPSSAAWPDA